MLRSQSCNLIRMVWLTALASSLAAAVVRHAAAAVLTINLASPTLDRWNYPFAADPGGNPYAAVFAPLTANGFDPNFDNRDGQMVIGFDTAAAGIASSLGPGAYSILSATLIVTVESDEDFAFDPTPDSYTAWLQPGDPEFARDEDPGHAVELFGAGFRYGFTAATYGEDAPYSPMGAFGKGIRTVYPLSFVNGACVDASNNVDERFDPAPFAVGLNPDLTPGQLVPADTELTFEIDVGDADIQRYFRSALDEGMLDVTIASIFPSEQQQSGTYPRFYCKEHLAVLLKLVSAARLEMTVEISDAPVPAGDVNFDGLVDVNDLLEVIGAWGPCACCAADLNADGIVNVDDLLTVISTWT